MKVSEYAKYDALGLAELIAKREVTAAEVMEAAIAAIEELNPKLNAVIHKSYERARQQAAGRLPQGPLRGVPFLLKDLGCGNLAGDPHHWGTTFLRDADFRARTTSYLVEKFLAAGLVVVGRTNVPELGAWAITEPRAYGSCRSPWNLDHCSGGSSGGAASAVAARMVPIAHASDGGGSIRNPASQCGLVGLKPTRGRISLGPDIGEFWGGMVFEFALSRTVRDTAALLDCVHGTMPGDPYEAAPPRRPYATEVGRDPGRLRIGLLSSHQGGVHADCTAAAESAARTLQSLGHDVEVSSPPDLAGSALIESLLVVIASAQAREVQVFGELLGRELGADDMDCDNWAVTEMGRQVSATRYLAALDAYQGYQRRMAAWWASGFDLLVTPTIAAPPPRIGEMIADPARPMDAFMRSGNLLVFCAPFNVTGQPAISLPLHMNAAGLPIGVQLVSAFGREDLLIQVASQLERSVGWAARLPAVHA
ncbi:MAG: amidase [Deltaproteobacteria bacterium]|nr:amidase [Deltaproteobacteria bacterium]